MDIFESKPTKLIGIFLFISCFVVFSFIYFYHNSKTSVKNEEFKNISQYNINDKKEMNENIQKQNSDELKNHTLFFNKINLENDGGMESLNEICKKQINLQELSDIIKKDKKDGIFDSIVPLIGEYFENESEKHKSAEEKVQTKTYNCFKDDDLMIVDEKESNQVFSCPEKSNSNKYSEYTNLNQSNSILNTDNLNFKDLDTNLDDSLDTETDFYKEKGIDSNNFLDKKNQINDFDYQEKTINQKEIKISPKLISFFESIKSEINKYLNRNSYDEDTLDLYRLYLNDDDYYMILNYKDKIYFF